MIIDATFWVAISFLIFVILLIYFKIPSKVKNILDENINKIKKQIEESEKLKEEAKNKLAEYEKKIGSSKSQVQKMIKEANEQSEKNIIKSNEIFHRLIEIRNQVSPCKTVYYYQKSICIEDCEMIGGLPLKSLAQRISQHSSYHRVNVHHPRAFPVLPRKALFFCFRGLFYQEALSYPKKHPGLSRKPCFQGVLSLAF